MSGRSGAISHTTLHEATKGNRLPSWGTTVEFVKACGADPATYRARWEEANSTVRSVATRPKTTDVEAEPVADTPDERPPDERATLTTDVAKRPAIHISLGPRLPRTVGAAVPPPPAEILGVVPPPRPAAAGRRRRPVVIVLAVAVVGVGAAVTIAVSGHRASGPDEDGGEPPGTLSKAALTPADCPVHVSNPAPAPPARNGDAAVFIADVTLPDCARVAPGKTVTKIWRLKNAGTVPWEGYSLHRLDLPQQADQCQTISDVPIDDTRPGKEVDIRTDITTPRKPGLCYVRFKLVDAGGKVAFPGNRPVNFQVIVEEGALAPRPGGQAGEPGPGGLRISGQGDPAVVRLEDAGVA
ncbi:NBR1-Ig-like domain-containing protein [Actinomadura litoris]|uniref:NBR1-Ig-like domain-containing protein n=1 Tax=Actinomadura litoris TaxID=2678616 RepID=UPI001FA6EDBF|nr:NBR1-Ig-like domain-containing protein [Actinomadura litoris]